MKRFKVCDLFCGAGGLSLGLQSAGFEVAAAMDSWQPAVETYRANFTDHICSGSITDDTTLPGCDVIAGGPPCQGFSSAGMRRSMDDRNSLVGVFAKLIVRHQPTAFVFENVEGFLTGGSGRFLFELLDPLISAGYRIHVRKINAANFGVPQHRKRVIAIGALGWDAPFPVVTHAAFGAPGAHLAAQRLPPTPTLLDAIGDLPEPSADDTSGLDHVAWPLNDDQLKRAKQLGPGLCMRDLPEEMWHESYKRRAFRRVMDGTPTERRGGAPAGLRRLRGDEPSKAITGGAINEFLHPTLHRPLTVRECARIQTFPDSFRFCGSRRDRIQLIGNAVPPHLATLIGQCLRDGLESRICDGNKGGELLSFVPTLSAGASPVLTEVIGEVASRYGVDSNSRQNRFQWA